MKNRLPSRSRIISYVRLYFRLLFKYKTRSFVGLVGLAFGLACLVPALYWLRYETTYDSFYPGADRLYRVYTFNRQAGQANELVSGILDGLDFRTTWDFATGLSGIAWGIEYLVQNGYEDCNTNIVCRDIDWKISQLSIVRMDDLSLDTGLEGILHYVLARAKGALAQNSKLPFNPDFLFEIRQVLKGLDRKKMSPSMAYLANEYDYFFTHEAINTYRLDIKSFIQTPEQHDIEQMTCGLKFGLAGLLYKIPGIHDS